MTMPAPTWFEPEPHELRRWAVAASVVVGVHALALFAYSRAPQPEDLGNDSAPISMDFSPGQDAVDQAAVEPTPEPPPPQEAEPPPPPPPPPPQAVALPEPPPPPKVEEQQPEQQPQPAKVRASAPSPRVKQSWALAVSKHLARHMARYPRTAISRDEEGVVHVSFRVDHAGRVSEVHLVQSSGHPDLDSAGLKMIEDSQPFPPLPADISDSENVIDFPLTFGLQKNLQ